MATARVITYVGPACPRCNAQLLLENITIPDDICPRCQGFFSAAVFHPPRRVTRVLQLAQSGPESASSCANHPRNAAVTNCDRCGVFICSLCELDLHGEKFCPSCFDRISQSGIVGGQNRFRDWRMLAIVTSLAGVFFSAAMLGIPLGGLTIYYVIRGFRDPERTGDKIAGLLLALLVAIGGIAASAWFFAQYFLK